MSNPQLPTEVTAAIEEAVKEAYDAAIAVHGKTGDSNLATLIGKQACRAMLVGSRKLPADMINKIVNNLTIDYVGKKVTGYFDVVP